MKANQNIRAVFQRENIIQKRIFELFWMISSYPRLIIEVVTRKHFGERYFTLASGITVGVILSLPPILLYNSKAYFILMGADISGGFWSKYILWYLYIGFYFYCVYLRWMEQRNGPSVYDLQKFSKSTGIIDPRIYKLKLFGKTFNSRAIEIYIEPGIFFLVGLLLWAIGQPLGKLFTFCSIIYSISYAAAYKMSDHRIMDYLDRMIVQEVYYDVLVNGAKPNDVKGVKIYGKKPNSHEIKQALYDNITADDDDISQVL